MAIARGKQDVTVTLKGGGVIAFTDEDMARGVAVGEAVGHMKAAHFYETVSQKVMIESYIRIKESKGYMGLAYAGINGEAKRVSSLEEFCQAFLGKTSRRLQQLESTYQLLGPDLYEKAEAIGLTSRDYAAIKALPADDQEVIKAAVADGDKDRLLATMEDMAVKHRREKELLEDKLKVSEGNDKAARTQLQKARGDLDEALSKLAKVESYSPQERQQVQDIHIANRMQVLQQGVAIQFRQLSVLIGDYYEHGRSDARESMVDGILLHLAQELYEVAVVHGCRIDFGQVLDPDLLDPAYQED